MPQRSEESKAKRLEYTRRWRASQRGKDYHADWRKENREREIERKRLWRAVHQDEIRAARARYYANHPRDRRIEQLPGKFFGHDFFDTARFICGPQPLFDWSLHWEDRMGEVILALVEGRDPSQAYQEEYRRQQNWVHNTGPLFSNVDVRQDHKVVFVSRRDIGVQP